MSRQIRQRGAVERFIAEIFAQNRVVFTQHFNQSQPIAIAIDVESAAAKIIVFSLDFALYGAVPGKNASLQQQLGCSELLHATSFPHSVRADILRACCSSVTSSTRGGMRSSRSIMVATSPKRRSALAYSSHTGSTISASCVSMICVPQWRGPAKLVFPTRSTGMPVRNSMALNPWLNALT